MGVSGCGKSTVASLLADRLDAAFLEGDAFHTPENVAKMSAGIPLTDEDRWPWLDRLARAAIEGDSKDQPVVLACSALKKAYRDRLRQWIPGLRVIYLRGGREVIEPRLTGRPGHFMPPGLLESQFAELEEPREAVVVGISRTPEELVEAILRELERSG